MSLQRPRSGTHLLPMRSHLEFFFLYRPSVSSLCFIFWAQNGLVLGPGKDGSVLEPGMAGLVLGLGRARP